MLKGNFHNVSDSVVKHFPKNQILNKNVHSKNHFLTEFTPLMDEFCIFWVFLKSAIRTQEVFLKIRTLNKKFRMCQILKQKN